MIPSFLISAAVSGIIAEYNSILGEWINDPHGGGPQKFHTKPTPRVGGIGVFLGVALGLLLFGWRQRESAQQAILLLLSSLPAFVAGLGEDITKQVPVRVRLTLCLLSGTLVFFLLEGEITRTGVPLLDHILNSAPLSLAFTMLAIGGYANAINIIDGFNGLAGGVCVIILCGLAYVCYRVDDWFLLYSCIVVLVSVLGFLVWNYPSGRIFLGDGGAYFLGFALGTISVLLVHRHPTVSPWFPVLLAIYPVWETLFSIYRRQLLRGASAGNADRLHLHSLIYKRVLKASCKKNEGDRCVLNSTTSVYLWFFSLISFIPAVIFWQETPALQIFTLSWIVFYIWLYASIVRFKTPIWFKLNLKPNFHGIRT
ncbi:MAG: glycosyltransferase [Geminocystis sp.]|nr:glycosyltransferase [Geminocystis sp.]